MHDTQYTVCYAPRKPQASSPWKDPLWAQGEFLSVASFHPQSSAHRPHCRASLRYDETALYGLFQIEDQYLISRHEAYQDPVYKDACVEFFVQPKQSKGYMNFEMNACGALLLRYIEDPARLPDGRFRKQRCVPWEAGRQVTIVSSIPGPVREEIMTPLTWRLYFSIPLSLLEAYVGPLGPLSGQEWRGNFNKCCEESSQPHWATWAPIGEKLDFHQPHRFGLLHFADPGQ